jgi:hypothetical protein
MNLRRLLVLVPRPASIGPGLKGAVTVMAFTDSGWMRRVRVPKGAMVILATVLASLSLTTILSVSYAVWAGADLRRLGAVERENQSLTAQLQEQATQLTRLQGEMSRLRELERSLRAVSGLADRSGESQGTGQGGALASNPRW